MEITLDIIKKTYYDFSRTPMLVEIMRSNEISVLTCEGIYSMHEAMNYGIMIGKQIERQRKERRKYERKQRSKGLQTR